jgi:hypothetical protein
MRSVMRSAALAAMVLFGAGQVQGGTVFDIMGTFGADIFGITGLVGGSFTATVDVVDLNFNSGALDVLGPYSFSVFDASHNLVGTYGDPTGAHGFIENFGTLGIGVGGPKGGQGPKGGHSDLTWGLSAE